MILKPQDVVISLKLVAIGNKRWTYNRMAVSLWMSPSEVHAGVKRILKARLATEINDRIAPNARNLEEFLIHGVPYVFVPDMGEMTRGMPTGFAGPTLSSFFQDSNELPPVWPYEKGEVRGQAFSPLYKSVPKAASEDETLYELLTLVDAIRGGRARERSMASEKISKWLKRGADTK
jgi:hypothetical protein